MSKRLGNLFMIFLIILIAILLGYALRIHHEGKIQEGFQSQAERELAILEEEFHSALENPHSFYIFNGKYEIYPVKESEKRFHYKIAKDNN